MEGLFDALKRRRQGVLFKKWILTAEVSVQGEVG